MRLKIVFASAVIGILVISDAAVLRPLASQAATDDAQLIASAMSAAPKSVGDGATIVALSKDGSMRTVRPGTNGFTCMPRDPAVGTDPMCMDANAMEWAHAWMSKTAPPDKTGFMYMLAGDSGASNTDPYATASASGNHWIKTGPHVMIVGPSAKLMAGYPTTPDPDVTKPYIMWAGTPYAHLMLPTK